MVEYKPFYVCEEMQKLRKLLDEKGIEWEDNSDTEFLWMCRTWFEADGYKVSVINGYGSYGGMSINEKNGELLELWFTKREPDSMGYLTAEDVMEIVFDGEENRHDQSEIR